MTEDATPVFEVLELMERVRAETLPPLRAEAGMPESEDEPSTSEAFTAYVEVLESALIAREVVARRNQRPVGLSWIEGAAARLREIGCADAADRLEVSGASLDLMAARRKWNLAVQDDPETVDRLVAYREQLVSALGWLLAATERVIESKPVRNLDEVLACARAALAAFEEEGEA